MNNLDPKILKIEMRQFGNNLSLRQDAKLVFSKLKESFQFNNYDLIVVDFEGVETVTSGYAFDLFILFREELKENFLQKIRVSFNKLDEASLVKSIIKTAFNASVQRTSPLK